MAHVAAHGSAGQAGLGKHSVSEDAFAKNRLVKPRVNLHTPQNVRQMMLLLPARRGCALAAALRAFLGHRFAARL